MDIYKTNKIEDFKTLTIGSKTTSKRGHIEGEDRVVKMRLQKKTLFVHTPSPPPLQEETRTSTGSAQWRGFGWVTPKSVILL